MVENTNAPNGFSKIGRLPGGTPNFEQAVRKIASAYNTAVYSGDPVVSVASGYIEKASPGVVQLAGIFLGCKYLLTSLGRTVWSPYWPAGGIATGDIEAYIDNDPQGLYAVQALLDPVTFAMIDANIQFNAGTGNAVTGRSGATVDATTVNTTTTLPFRVYGLADPALPGGNASENYNRCVVAWNNQDFKSLTGIN